MGEKPCWTHKLNNAARATSRLVNVMSSSDYDIYVYVYHLLKQTRGLSYNFALSNVFILDNALDA